MQGVGSSSLALLVRSRPHTDRETRSRPDLALAAAALDFRVEVYFIGSALMQLAAELDSAAALLPAGYRAWAAVTELSEACFFADAAWLERLEGQGIDFIVPVHGLGTDSMRQRWRECAHVVVV